MNDAAHVYPWKLHPRETTAVHSSLRISLKLRHQRGDAWQFLRIGGGILAGQAEDYADLFRMTTSCKRESGSHDDGS